MSFSEQTWEKLIVGAIGLIILTVIYFASLWNTIVGTIVLGLGVWFWLTLTPAHSNDSDPAGNAMAAGFAGLLDIAISIVLAVTFYLFITYSNPNNVLNVSMIILFLYFVKRYIWAYFRK
ncbi:MAG: hypothetical protein K6F33_03020 [Bacteroidales bacterium]|nr:hypothetical protein [Bacteroidales bacterium]